MAFRSSWRGIPHLRRRYDTGLEGSVYVRRFYVDATVGADGNDGLSPMAPWQTIGKVNGESFLPGDQILFKRGETWDTVPLGRNLVPPSSGATGTEIIFDAYGSGAAPIIDAGGSGSPALLLGTSYVIAQNLELTGADDPPVRFIGAQNCILQDCTIHTTNVSLIHVSDTGGVTTSNNIIRRNEGYGATREGFYVKNLSAADGTSNILIENNTIHDCGMECIQNTFDAAASVAPPGTIVRWNTIYNAGDVGPIQVWADALVEKNEIYGSGGDYSGIHVENGSGAVIRNNLIHDYSFNRANNVQGIRLANTVTNASVYHNTIYNISNTGAGDGRGIYCANGGSGTNIKNNGISGCDDQMIWDLATPPTADRNAVFGVCTNTGTNAVVADPLLVNPGAGDFHLQVGSPCRGAGATDTGVDDDYDGVARSSPPDIGAYQYVA